MGGLWAISRADVRGLTLTSGPNRRPKIGLGTRVGGNVRSVVCASESRVVGRWRARKFLTFRVSISITGICVRLWVPLGCPSFSVPGAGGQDGPHGWACEELRSYVSRCGCQGQAEETE